MRLAKCVHSKIITRIVRKKELIDGGIKKIIEISLKYNGYDFQCEGK